MNKTGYCKLHKRWVKISLKGISHEQVCVLVSMDKNGNILSRNAVMGRITAKEIDGRLKAWINLHFKEVATRWMDNYFKYMCIVYFFCVENCGK